MAEVPIILFAVTCVAIVIALGHRAEKQRQEVWRLTAERLGLQSDGVTIYGTYEDVTVNVRTVSRGHGRNKTTYTIFTADLSRVPGDLLIVHEGFFHKVGKFAGMKDIQLDLPGIDEKVMVRQGDPDEVRRWAQRSDVSRALQDLTLLSGLTYKVTDHALSLEAVGGIREGARIESTLEQLTKLSAALSCKGYGALTDDGHW